MSEFTREVLEGAACCALHRCIDCGANTVCTHSPIEMTATLATALLAEMDKPGDVWKDAPEGSTSADVLWFRTPSGGIASGHKRYTRELPKSRARVIAEEAWADCHSDVTTKEEDIARIESAILKREAELEAGKC